MQGSWSGEISWPFPRARAQTAGLSEGSGELLMIGAFSRRTRLLLKALRIYDESGLLRPVLVDPHTGYRYYSEDQAELARLIGLLRTLEMPLARIAEVVAMDPETAVESIGGYCGRWRPT